MILQTLLFILSTLVPLIKSQIATCIGFESGTSDNACTLCDPANYYSKGVYKQGVKFPSSDCLARPSKTDMTFYYDAASTCTASCDATSIANSPKTLHGTFLVIEAAVTKLQKGSKIDILIVSEKNVANLVDLGTDKEVYLFRSFQGVISIKPLYCTAVITTKCVTAGVQVSILIQTDAFHFFIANSLTLENIIFDGSDLHVPAGNAFGTNTDPNADCKDTTMNVAVATDPTTTPCALIGKKVPKPTSDNRMGMFNLEPMLTDTADANYKAILILTNVKFMNITAVRDGLGYSSIIQIFNFQKTSITITSSMFFGGFVTNGIIYKIPAGATYYKLVKDANLAVKVVDTAAKTNPLSLTIDQTTITYFNRYGVVYDTYPDLINIVGGLSVIVFKKTNFLLNSLKTQGILTLDFTAYSADSSLSYIEGTITPETSNYIFQFTGGVTILAKTIIYSALDKLQTAFVFLNSNLRIEDSTFNGPGVPAIGLMTIESKDTKTSDVTIYTSKFLNIITVPVGYYLINVKTVVAGLTASQLVELPNIVGGNKAKDKLTIDLCTFTNTAFLLLKNENFLISFTLTNSAFTATTLTTHLSVPFVIIVVEENMVVRNVSMTGLKSINSVFTVQYGRNFTFDTVTVTDSEFNNYIYVYVIAKIDPAFPILGNLLKMKFTNIKLTRKPPVNPTDALDNIRLYSFPTYNKNFGIFRLTFDSLEFREVTNEKSVDDFIIFFASGHVIIQNCFFQALKNIGTHRFFSRLGDTSFSITNATYDLKKYNIDSIILVTSSYFIKNLKIIDTSVEGNPTLPIRDASLFEYQAVGTFEMRNVNISNVYTPKGTALSLILDNLPGIKIFYVNFKNNKGTANMGADMVMEIKAIQIGAAWPADITTVPYGIQHSNFDSSTSSLTLLDGGELLIYNVTFKNLNGSRGPVLNIGSGCNVYMKKFTITNIKADQNGGAFAMSNTIFKLYDGTITNVSAGNKGGIFTVNKQSVIEIANVNINVSSSKYGGILFSEDSNVTIRDSVFQNSKAEQEGGHFFLKTTNMDLSNVKINGGQASTAGCIFGRFSQFNMLNVELNGCKSSVDKGVGNFYMLGLPKQKSTFKFFKCLNSIAMTGACLVVRNSNITFEDSEFTGNTATKQHIFDFSYTGPGEISFTRCTFQDNVANLTITKTKNTVLSYINVIFQNNFVENGDFLNQIEEQSLLVQNTTITSSVKDLAAGKYQYIFQLNDVVSVQVKDTTFDGKRKVSFMTCSPCNSLNINGSTFSNGFGLNGSVIKASSSIVTVNSSKFQLNLAGFSGAIYSENSNLTIRYSTFSDNSAVIEGSDLSIKNQDNSKSLNFVTTVESSTFTRFNQSSIYTMNDILTLNGVNLQETKAQGQSRALHIGNSYSLKITNVRIDNMKSFGGIKILNENQIKMDISISKSNFINCSNDDFGGFINAKGALTMKIDNTLFYGGNTSQSGGGIFCDGKDCSIILNDKNNFTKNNAVSIGGAIYANRNPVIQNSPATLLNNTAAIGDNIYTFPLTIVVVNYADFTRIKNGCLKGINNTNCKISDFKTTSTMQFATKSGQAIQFGVILLDHQSNLMESESEAILEVIGPSGANGVTLEGFYSKVGNGIAEFPKLITVGATGKTFELKIQFRKDDIQIDQAINVFISKCGRGEYYAEIRCVECPQSFYSLSYDPEAEKVTECTKCKENAKCDGGQRLVPNPGYWRASDNSSLIVKCLFSEACPTQANENTLNYKCSSEYQGNICLNCAQQYGRTSKGCVLCSSDGLGYFLFFFKAFITLGLMVFECNIAMYIGNNLTKSLLRIIFMHNAYWIIITDGGNVNTNIADTLTSSFGFLNDHFSAAPKDVFNYYCFLTGLSDANSIFEANLILQTVIPLIFAVATFILKIILDLITGKLKSTTKNKVRHFLYSIFIAIIISHRNWYPRILNSISSLFKCEIIGFGDTQYLTDNPDLQCYSSNHNTMIGAIIVPSIIVWCISVPFMIFYFIIKNKKKTWSKRETFKTIVTKKSNMSAKVDPKSGKKSTSIEQEEIDEDEGTGKSSDTKITKRDSIFFYLVYDYKPHFFYWYFVEIMVVFGLSLLSQLFNEVDYTIKNMVIFVCIAILFLIYQKLQVFDTSLNNTVASLSIGVTLFSIVALLIGANEKTSDIVKQLCMVIMIILNMAFFAICILLIVFKKAQHYMSKFSTVFSKKKSMKTNSITPKAGQIKAKPSK